MAAVRIQVKVLKFIVSTSTFEYVKKTWGITKENLVILEFGSCYLATTHRHSKSET